MKSWLISAASVAVFTGAVAIASAEQEVDGDRMAECYAAYDAMIGLDGTHKLSADDKAKYDALRSKAEAKGIALYKSEGLDEELAREQLAGRAEFMHSEFRELHQGTGVYGIEDVKKIASDCEALVAN
ncbi:MAG: hypothetical protein ABL973_14850 [Micropepsaceae bacterium]